MEEYDDLIKMNSINCKLPDKSDAMYIDIVEIDKEKLDKFFLSKNIDNVCYAILSTCYYQNYESCIKVCKHFFYNFDNKKVISTIFNGLCVICTRFKHIEHEFLDDIINMGLNSQDKFINQCAENLLDDTHLIKGYKFKSKKNRKRQNS